MILSALPFFRVQVFGHPLVGEGCEGLAIVQPWPHDLHKRISYQRVAAGMDIATHGFQGIPQHHEYVERKQRGDERRRGGAVDGGPVLVSWHGRGALDTLTPSVHQRVSKKKKGCVMNT